MCPGLSPMNNFRLVIIDTMATTSLFLYHPPRLASLAYPFPLTGVYFRRVHTIRFEFLLTLLPRPLALDFRYFALPLQDPFPLLLLLDPVVSLPLSALLHLNLLLLLFLPPV